MRDYDALLHRAKWEKLSQEEIDNVATELQQPEPEADRYILLFILGRAGALSYRWLVEQFLACEDDPMLSRKALEVLCDDWNDTARYLDQVLEFVLGVKWDEEEDVRPMAISIAGEYLRSHDEPRLLSELVRIFENEDEPQTMREGAYFALARAAGRDWKELPSAARHFDLSQDTDPSVLREARERLVAQEV